ncbi:MAG: ATP-binding cassette domain-containing protein [Clostridiales bacterium]|nr:ATP-binding cassette domain-containing protein [Clostridiales bacterium]
MSEQIIRLQGVTKEFDTKGGKVVALKDIDLDIEKGDSYGIIGLSGAGKSTLVRTINLLEEPTEGKVVFDGQVLTGLSARELNIQRRRISMIFQQFNLLMQRDAIGNICFPLEIAGVPKAEAVEKAKELLKVVDLEERAHSYPSQLSGGQKQRVAIARALASDPEVILCDEATSALDPKTTRAILSLLRRINEERGITLVVITHEMEVIKQLCNKVAVIENGEIVERGDVQEIFKKPKTKAARKLFFPDGQVTEKPLTRTSTRNRVRLVYDEANAGEPIIANMIMELGAPVNFLYANLDVLGGAQKGQMVICLAEDRETAEKQKEYLRAKGVEFTEIDEDEYIDRGEEVSV